PVVLDDGCNQLLGACHAIVRGMIALDAHRAVAGDARELFEREVVAVERDCRRHAPISASNRCTAATRSARGAVICPGLAVSHSLRSPSLSAFARPTAMSLIVTMPCCFSFVP